MQTCKICNEPVELEIIPGSKRIVKTMVNNDKEAKLRSVADFKPMEHGLCVYHRKVRDKMLTVATIRGYSGKELNILRLR